MPLLEDDTGQTLYKFLRQRLFKWYYANYLESLQVLIRLSQENDQLKATIINGLIAGYGPAL